MWWMNQSTELSRRALLLHRGRGACRFWARDLLTGQSAAASGCCSPTAFHQGSHPHSVPDPHCTYNRAHAKLNRSVMPGWNQRHGAFLRTSDSPERRIPAYFFVCFSSPPLGTSRLFLTTWLSDERWDTAWLLLQPRRGSSPGGSTNRAPRQSWGRACRRLSGRQCWWWVKRLFCTHTLEDWIIIQYSLQQYRGFPLFLYLEVIGQGLEV